MSLHRGGGSVVRWFHHALPHVWRPTAHAQPRAVCAGLSLWGVAASITGGVAPHPACNRRFHGANALMLSFPSAHGTLVMCSKLQRWQPTRHPGGWVEE